MAEQRFTVLVGDGAQAAVSAAVNLLQSAGISAIAALADGAELQGSSSIDALTQLYNHRFLEERLREEFRRAQRYDDPLSLILIELDHFKAINDRFGTPVGDEVLREVSHALKASTRETDLLARSGGEKFAAILPKTHLSGALTVAQRVLHRVPELQQAGSLRSIRLAASLGVSGYPHRAVVSPETLLITADQALFRAMGEGGNRICLHQPRSSFSDTAAKTA